MQESSIMLRIQYHSTKMNMTHKGVFFLGLIMSLVPIFGAKSQFGPSIFFSSQFGSCFGKFDLNVVLSVSGIVTALNGVPRVSFSIF